MSSALAIPFDVGPCLDPLHIRQPNLRSDPLAFQILREAGRRTRGKGGGLAGGRTHKLEDDRQRQTEGREGQGECESQGPEGEIERPVERRRGHAGRTSKAGRR